MLTFAVGSVRGCASQLANLLEQCHVYAGHQSARYVFLGNFINQGPDSRGVVEKIIDLQNNSGNRVIALAGENETLLREWEIGDNMPRWLNRGGGATLRSYAVSSPADLPQDHLTWLKSLHRSFDDQLRYFAGAGLKVEPTSRAVVVISNRQAGQTSPTSPGQSIINLDKGAGFGRPVMAAVFASDQVMPLDFIKAEI